MRSLDGTAEHPSSVFVGRERECARLREWIAAARDGSGGFALISGEAGIGKTRLVEHLAADAGSSGWSVLWSQCQTGAGVPPYLPWLRLFRSWCLVVTKRIRAAVARIRIAHPRLGHHLTTSVRTGLVCVYTQAPGERAIWDG
jgi:predicted ATPase